MTLTSQIIDSSLVLFLEDRIDSANSADAEKLIFDSLVTPHDSLVLDLQKLTYISSAGLRIILKLKKQEKNFSVVNASNDVYDIFEMTGFTEMISIAKAYRQVSVDGCEEIGHGANGRVYRLDPETIIKVYSKRCNLDDIKHERELAKRAFILGIPTAISYDIVKVGDSFGSIFELLNAKSFAQQLNSDPDNAEKYANDSISLLKKIHATEVNSDNFPSMKEIYLGRVKNLKDQLPQEVFKKVEALFENIPESNKMIHGDYHIKNIMFQNGETLLIDMDTLSHGNPVFEFAAIYLAYIGFGENNHANTEQFMGIEYETALYVWDKTMQLYFGSDDQDKLSTYANKIKLVAYVRKLEREIRHDGYNNPSGLIEIESCKQHIITLVDLVDSLAL